MNYLIGIDDTDNKSSRGTGFKARKLGDLLHKSGFAKLDSISRHQLYFHPDIPYTSHNSSACLQLNCTDENKLIRFCEDFIKSEAEPGSDAGLCIAHSSQVSKAIHQYGLQAKRTILHQKQATELSTEHQIYLKGFTGDFGGIIGALAAVGLRSWGNDGRFIWLNGLRSLKNGIYSVRELLSMIDIDNIASLDNRTLNEFETVFVNDWVRPVLREGKKIILVEEIADYELYQWETASKSYIRSIS